MMDRTTPWTWCYSQVGFIIIIIIIMAVVKIGTDGQNVQVGEVSFEIGEEATVNCTFDGSSVVAVYWAASTEKPASFPTSAIIIQKTLSGGVTVPNEEKYGGRVNLTDSYSLVINTVELDFDTPWYACQATVGGNIRFDAKKAARIARGTMSSENTCTESSDSQLVCTQDDTLTCKVDGFTPNTNFQLGWNTEALVIGEQGELTISEDPALDGYFTAFRTLTIKPTEATAPISVVCTALGNAYMYAESERLVGDPVNITVKGGAAGLGGGPIAGIVICVIVVIGASGAF